MNPLLERLQPYPFEKLKTLLAGASVSPALMPIDLSIGEPKHPTPSLVKEALAGALDGLAAYPPTLGTLALREAIAGWLARRYGIPPPDAALQVLPVNGSREALFAFAQAVIDARSGGARVACPNPFYQIYEGAALLAGATPVFVNPGMDFPDVDWTDVQLAYVCSPANPSGRVMRLQEWKTLFELSDRHGFVIASDECYSELYYDESAPPLGALQAAHALGRGDYRRLVVFSSLSKRSNAPGLRSGFAAGDAAVLRKFLLYRTYHGSAMSLAVQHASVASWGDEAHVRENRRLYAEKYARVLPIFGAPLATGMPEGGFYLWVQTPVDDCEFARRLYREYNVRVLPGSYLARDAYGENPGKCRVRIALVAPIEECINGAERIMKLARSL
jgi:N-succinyldiaminopimelate aminotransferase